MSIEEDIRNQIYNCQNQIAANQARIGQINQKLGRLYRAKDRVRDIYDDDKGFVAWIEGYDVGPGWMGSKREKFEDKKTNTKGQGDRYCSKVNEAYCMICDKITQLENEKMNGSDILSSAYRMINSLQNDLNKALSS